MSDVQLKIGGKIHRGWTSIRIRRSLEQIADSFDLELTDRWENNQEPRIIRTGEPCEIWIDDTKIITGYVDDVYPTYNESEHTLNVTGRSKAGDLVDCSLPGDTFNNQTLLQMATKLFKPFGISVSTYTDTGGPFKQQVLEEGQSPFEFIENLARVRAVRMVSDVDGNVELVRTGNNKIFTALRLGDNIKQAAGEFSSIDLFREYIVSGQQKGGDSLTPDDAAHTTSTITSSYVNRYRPTLLLIDTPADIADCKKRGEWQRNTTFGRSRGIVYTVLGWHHEDGLWSPNNKVTVDDDFLQINDERLISDVEFLLDDKGLRTELRVVPKEAFDLIKLPDPVMEDAQGL